MRPKARRPRKKKNTKTTKRKVSNDICVHYLAKYPFISECVTKYICKSDILNICCMSKTFRILAIKEATKVGIVWNYNYIKSGTRDNIIKYGLADIGNIINYSAHIESLKDIDKIMKHIPKNNLTHLTFDEHFDQPITENTLPPMLKHVTFGGWFDRPLKKGVLPPNITYLTFGTCYDQPLEGGMLPNSLTHLTIKGIFNQPLMRDTLPVNLTHLTILGNYDQPIGKDVLPDNLKYLTFGRNYKQHIGKGVLPHGVFLSPYRLMNKIIIYCHDNNIPYHTYFK